MKWAANFLIYQGKWSSRPFVVVAITSKHQFSCLCIGIFRIIVCFSGQVVIPTPMKLGIPVLIMMLLLVSNWKTLGVPRLERTGGEGGWKSSNISRLYNDCIMSKKREL